MNVNEATTYYAVVDCDNCFVSCERVFRPDLRNKPVVVLSNNDGCVVARSNEAKRLGVKAGTPFFRLAEQFPGCYIAVFSSNYELYGDMTARVMSKVRQAAPEFYRYSIDEAFVVIRDGRDLKALERPGLWNGAMSDWNTVFVDVDLLTFNPVKTVNDLLRPMHQF